jgi:hypothetical protein
MQLALLLLALLCFGERGWGSYHGIPSQDPAGAVEGSQEENSEKLAEKFIQSFSEFEKGVPSPQEMRKVYDDLNELKDKVSDKQFNELVDKVSALQDVYLLLDRAEDLSGSKDSLVDQTAKLGKLGEELKDLEEKIPSEVKEAAWEKLKKKGDSNLSAMGEQALDFGKKLAEKVGINLGKPAPAQEYGPSLPPRDHYSSTSYGLNFGAPKSTYDPLTKKWTPYQDTVEGLVDYMQRSSASSGSGSGSGSGSASGSGSSSGSSGSSFSGGSHSIGFASESESESESVVPSTVGSSTLNPSPSPTSLALASETPTGVSQPPISGSTSKATPSPLAGGSTAPSTPTGGGGHGGGSQTGNGASLPVGTNVQTPSTTPSVDASAIGQIQAEKQKALAKDSIGKSTEELGKALSAGKTSPPLISFSDLKPENGLVGTTKPETGVQTLENRASAGQVTRYQNSPEPQTRSYASNDRFITPEKAASSNSAKEIKSNSDTSSSETFSGSNPTNTSVGEQKPLPKANKTSVALLGNGPYQSDLEEIAQPGPAAKNLEPPNLLAKPEPKSEDLTVSQMQETLMKGQGIGPFAGVSPTRPKIPTQKPETRKSDLGNVLAAVENPDKTFEPQAEAQAPKLAGAGSVPPTTATSPRSTQRGIAGQTAKIKPPETTASRGIFQRAGERAGAYLDDVIKFFFSK